ncbi:response regulator [Spirosoma validum]|uniref:Response regulator n=1 Tax=Spirosoma validum TaxID=2771355 RepID=A0A927B0N8_9BACT|nr:response regulator [Spirosoma validum]MBD2753396.1 response regulator [Spirosoma validum]
MTSTRFICIVDDSADYRLLLQQLLLRFLPDYPVRFFANGKIFLEELREMSHQPSLIILDRHMPEMNGHQTLEYLKQHPAYRTIPVVMMSSVASESEIYGCYESGANSFLLKPTDFEGLRNTIVTVCDYWLKLNQEPVTPDR